MLYKSQDLQNKVTVKSILIDTKNDHQVIDASSNSSRVFVMRSDENYVTKKLCKAFEGICSTKLHVIYSRILFIYREFLEDLIDILTEQFSKLECTEIHIYDASNLEENIRSRLANTDIGISIDPLISDGLHNLYLSRGFYKGGTRYKEHVGSPGFQALADQIGMLAKICTDNNVALIEDDVFSGATLSTLVKLLAEHRIHVSKIIVGIRFGKASKLLMGIPIESVVTYVASKKSIQSGRVNLCDPGDFLLGARGLVTQLNDEQYGRCPYLFPFVKVTDKVGLPEAEEYSFSRKLLIINEKFFFKLERILGQEIYLKDLDPNLIEYLENVPGVSRQSKVTEMLYYAEHNMLKIWRYIAGQGKLQEHLGNTRLTS